MLRQLHDVIADHRVVRRVEDDIYSVLPAASGAAPRHYDRMAAGYDRIIGNPFYQRLTFGNRPADYAAFARAALGAAPGGPFLDAGCGSLLFTAEVYRRTRRPVVALDESLGMLRRARTRLAGPDGRLPAHILLLQGDLFDLPFRPASFPTILAEGVLHLVAEAEALVGALDALLADGGRLYLTSLVTSGRLADYYLRWIHLLGEVARPRGAAELRRLLTRAARPPEAYTVKGNMAYATLTRRG